MGSRDTAPNSRCALSHCGSRVCRDGGDNQISGLAQVMRGLLGSAFSSSQLAETDLLPYGCRAKPQLLPKCHLALYCTSAFADVVLAFTFRRAYKLQNGTTCQPLRKSMKEGFDSAKLGSGKSVPVFLMVGLFLPTVVGTKVSSSVLWILLFLQPTRRISRSWQASQQTPRYFVRAGKYRVPAYKCGRFGRPGRC